MFDTDPTFAQAPRVPFSQLHDPNEGVERSAGRGLVGTVERTHARRARLPPEYLTLPSLSALTNPNELKHLSRHRLPFQ